MFGILSAAPRYSFPFEQRSHYSVVNKPLSINNKYLHFKAVPSVQKSYKRSLLEHHCHIQSNKMEVKDCHDPRNGFGIMQSYDALYCQGEADQLEVDIYENGTGTQQFHQVKHEKIHELRRIQLLDQVKSEPIEEEFIAEDQSGYQLKNEELEDQSEYLLKNEELEDQFQNDYSVYKVVFDVKDNAMEEQHPFQCSHCPKSFVQKTKLQRHIKTHLGERPYTCSYCQAAFSRSEHLQRHVRKHTGERPYSCALCSSSFSRKEHLQRHNRTHTGERPYKCSYCQETFTKNETLQRHYRKHTGERPYHCINCQATFTRSEHLQRHARTHRGEE